MFLFDHPVKALQFQNEYKNNMIENLLIDNDETANENVALHQLSAMLRENGNSTST